ncbi:MAG: hypothetical protein SFV51_30955 [Bryobacteraceae bacterium]|nr:hypothetical protein [Bryobacteraceae bacterium]
MIYEDFMYSQRLVTLTELQASSGEPSLKALRSRATAGILRYIRSQGSVQLFDHDLSIIRCQAARACKVPGITWTRIEFAVRRVDQELDRLIVEKLNSGVSFAETKEAAKELLRTALRY